MKPRLYTRLFGGTKRGAHPKLRAVLMPRPGQANLARAAVTLPRSEFLDQANIRTVCTRVQFAANACPQGAIYGRAVAFTPLLDQPLSGPVYLRSSSHKLPDLVLDLHGQIEIEASARIDSKNKGIRTTFEAIPDAPLSKLVLYMKGGKKKGLLVNSRNICTKAYRATANLKGQNGRKKTLKPQLKNGKCKKKKRQEGEEQRAAVEARRRRLLFTRPCEPTASRGLAASVQSFTATDDRCVTEQAAVSSCSWYAMALLFPPATKSCLALDSRLLHVARPEATAPQAPSTAGAAGPSATPAAPPSGAPPPASASPIASSPWTAAASTPPHPRARRSAARLFTARRGERGARRRRGCRELTICVPFTASSRLH